MGAGFRIQAKAGNAAEILLYEDVGESFFGGISAKQFATELKALGKVAAIDLRINSYGGDVFDGLAIYRQLVDHPARITAHIDGVAASIASVVAMAAEEIRIAESAFLMIHNASGVVIGNASDMRDLADKLDVISGSIRDVYVARTGIEPGRVRAWMDEEKWFTAAEAAEAGFVSQISENMNIAARFDPTKHKFAHAPEQLLGRPAFDSAVDRIARMRARLFSASVADRPRISAG